MERPSLGGRACPSRALTRAQGSRPHQALPETLTRSCSSHEGEAGTRKTGPCGRGTRRPCGPRRGITMAIASRLGPRLGRTDPESRGRRGFGLGPRRRVRVRATVSLGRGRREHSLQPRLGPKEGGREPGGWLPRPRSKPPPLSVSALLKGRIYIYPADTKALHRGLPPQP